MKEYSLILNNYHFAPLLESLRLHQVSIENAPGSTEQEKAIMSDLLRRAELLHACAKAGANLSEAQAAYHKYCEEGDAPTVAPVKVVHRLI